jgi:trehalose 6-phosphate phosphatase
VLVLPLAERRFGAPADHALPGASQFDLASFMNAVAESPRSVLLLDYDGTLAPFRSRRDQAFPYPQAAVTIQAIQCTGRTRVVLVTGRDASEVLPLLGVHPHPEVWGLHGLQRLREDGCSQMPPLDESTLQALAHAENWVDYQHLHDTAEFKLGSIALHWRGLGNQRAAEIRDRILLGWRPIAAGSNLCLLDFDGGVEIRPRQRDKGDAVRAVLAEMGPSAPAAYLGDDSTDEPAFLAMGGRGLSVLVRPEWRKTSAQFWLRPPEELLEFLSRWLKASQSRDDEQKSHRAAGVNL